jgi:Zn-dependent protease with chaperone function
MFLLRLSYITSFNNAELRGNHVRLVILPIVLYFPYVLLKYWIFKHGDQDGIRYYEFVIDFVEAIRYVSAYSRRRWVLYGVRRCYTLNGTKPPRNAAQ